MGTVYLAEQTGPGGFRREVVLKLIHARASDLGDHRLLLLDEAQLTALISHPNVVTVYEVGEHLGQVYIALERVRGISLAVMTQRLGGRRLPFAVSAALIAQACEGLHAAHELRRDGQPLHLVHRDVSPSNLMCDVGGRVRVIDFGIARADVRRIVTDPSAVRGNPAYMAPEQRPGAQLDRTADVYSTALVFYEMCIGAHPFRRSTYRGSLPPLSAHCDEIPAEIDDVVAAALSLDPHARPREISTLGAALWAFAREVGLSEPAHLADYFHAQNLSLEPDPPRREPLELRMSSAPREHLPPTPRAPATVGVCAREVHLGAGGPPVHEVVLPDGREVVVYTTRLRSCERGEHRLVLSQIADLLPTPMLVGCVGGALRITCDRSTGSGWRAALYVDATQPHTRLDSLLLTETSLPQTFDVGHRKSAVRPIRCAVGRRGPSRVIARLPDLSIAFSAPADLMLLALLAARDDAGLTHVECVCVSG